MENEKKAVVFADGIVFTKKRDGAPDFVKGGVSVRVEQFYTWAKQHVNQNGFVNLDLLKSREKGTLYFKLNTWKKDIPKPEFGEVAEPLVDTKTSKGYNGNGCKDCTETTECSSCAIPF